MKPYVVKCPTCGGQLRAESGPVTCEYCQQSVAVEGNGMIESPLPRESRTWLLVLALGTLTVVILPVVLKGDRPPKADEFQPFQRPTEPRGDTPPPSRVPTMKWKAKVPIVVDANADGTMDVVGFTADGDGAKRAVALSGVDGSQLWTTETITGAPRGAKPRLYLCADALVAVSLGGILFAYHVKDGRTRWEIRLAEEVQEVTAMAGSEPTALARLEDSTLRRVSLSTGHVTPARDGDSGIPFDQASTAHLDRRGGCTLRMGFGDSIMPPKDVRNGALEGLEIRGVARAHDGSFSVAAAVPDRGSAIPMLTRYDFIRGRTRGESTLEELWRTRVPKTNPLLTHGSCGSPDQIHASDQLAAVAYRSTSVDHSEPYRIGAFRMEDGERLWDAPVPGQANLTSVTVVGDRVYLVTWAGLHVLAGDSGSLLWEALKLPIGDG